jgi:hypothetical protein
MALSDILKKYGDTAATEGIMFPSAGVQPVTTEQEVYDSATDGIMTINNEKYIGPTATVTYAGEDQGYARTLRQIEQGELPQFDQSAFPEVGTGVMQPTTPVTPPVTTPVEPEQPATPIDPCPAGYKLINGVCQPIQQQDRDRPQEEPMFGPGKTPFQNVEFANNIIFKGEDADGNPQFNYYKDNQIVLKQPSIDVQQTAALQDYFNKNNIDLDASNLDVTAYDAYAKEAGLNVPPRGNNVKFNLSNISNKPEGGTSFFPGFNAVMALAEKDMIKGALNLYNNAGLTTGMYIGDSVYYAGTAEYNTAFNNALKNNSDFNLIFDPTKVDNFNKNFGKLNTDIQANRNLLNNLSKLNKDMVETTIVKLAASGEGVDRIKNMSKAQLIAFASPREDIHAKSFGFNKYSPKTKKQIVEAKHDNDSISKTSTDTINRMANDERAGYRVDVRELSKREHNNKNSYASKNKETADETIARIAKNVEEDPMAKRTGSSAFADEKTKQSIKSGNDSKNEKKIVCTMMNESYGFGSFRNKIWLAQSKNLSKEYEIGYHTLFLPLVKYAKQKGFTNSIVKKILEHIAIHRTIDIRKQKYNKVNILGRTYRIILEPLCYITGGIKTWKKK